MGYLGLLRRRLLGHPTALAAVTFAVLVALTAITALDLLSSALATESTRSVSAAEPRARSLLVAGVARGSLAATDSALRRTLDGLGPATRVTRVGTLTSMGIRGRDARDRARVLENSGLQGASDLVSGRWPGPPSEAAARGDGEIEVTLPQPGASALGASVGDTVALTSLVNEGAKPLTLRITGLYQPREAADPAWLDDELSLAGVATGDFTTYGPFALAPGSLDGPLGDAVSVVWRASPDVSGLTPDAAARLAVALREVEHRVRVGLGLAPGEGDRLGLTSAQVDSGLPGLLDEGLALAARVRASLLSPAVLLAGLSAVSLAVSAGLLQRLRAADTALLRARGASSGQVAAVGAGEAAVIVAVGALGAGLAAPWLAVAIASVSGLRTAVRPWASGPALIAAALAAFAVLAVALARSQAPDAVLRSRPRALTLLLGSGADLAVVALGAVGLARVAGRGSAAADPLTAVAPALVLAGLSVLALRGLPLLGRAPGRLVTRARGLAPAWVGWQLGRRLAVQTPMILLVMLTGATGILALAQSATLDRAIDEQSVQDVGADLRVQGSLGRIGEGSAVADVVGGWQHVTTVLRGSASMGSLPDVTVLGVDADTSGSVLRTALRPPDRPWPELSEALRAGRPAVGGVRLPQGTRARRLHVRADLPRAEGAGSYPLQTSVFVRDARGVVSSWPVGAMEPTGDYDFTCTLPDASALPGPLDLVAVAAAVPAYSSLAPSAALAILSADADGAPLDTAPLRPGRRDDSLYLSAPGAPLDALPSVVTRGLAEAAGAEVGGRLDVVLDQRRLPLRVVGIVATLPTVESGEGVVVDLASLYALPRSGGDGGGPSLLAREPQEAWAQVADSARAAATLRAELPQDVEVRTLAASRQARTVQPVNVGMRAAMVLLAAAGAALAVVGFAASSAATAMVRRHDAAVLTALGTPARTLRRAFAAEAALFVAVTVLLGLVLGLIASWAIAPLLVGTDGHRQVPPVIVVVPWQATLLLLLALGALFALVAALSAPRRVRTPATVLRGSDS